MQQAHDDATDAAVVSDFEDFVVCINHLQGFMEYIEKYVQIYQDYEDII
jgi:hypothetical protein